MLERLKSEVWKKFNNDFQVDVWYNLPGKDFIWIIGGYPLKPENIYKSVGDY